MSVLAVLVFCSWKVVTWTREDVCHKEEATTLVLGNSRIQYGFDDSIIPKTFNGAAIADNYNIIYWKLKLLHKYNPQLKNVIVTCDQLLVFSYLNWVPDKIHPYYLDILTLEDWWGLVANHTGILLNPMHYFKLIFPLKSIVANVSFQDLGIGGYSPLYREVLYEDPAYVNREKPLEEVPVMNEYNVSYLRKIHIYCQKNNLKLFFVNMPSYPTRTTIEGNQYLHKFVEEYYPDVPFFDYELMQFPDSCYGDVSHLNYRGAKIISEKIAGDMFELHKRLDVEL